MRIDFQHSWTGCPVPRSKREEPFHALRASVRVQQDQALLACQVILQAVDLREHGRVVERGNLFVQRKNRVMEQKEAPVEYDRHWFLIKVQKLSHLLEWVSMQSETSSWSYKILVVTYYLGLGISIYTMQSTLAKDHSDLKYEWVIETYQDLASSRRTGGRRFLLPVHLSKFIINGAQSFIASKPTSTSKMNYWITYSFNDQAESGCRSFRGRVWNRVVTSNQL